MLLMHEIGHAIDFPKIEEAGDTTLVDAHEHAKYAEYLRRERVPTAFSLKALRPLLNSEQRQDLITVAKHDALDVVYDWAKIKIAIEKEMTSPDL
jgi:hypothetical protein